MSQTRLDAPRADTSVGPPIPGIEVRIVDAMQRDVDAGAVGELWVRGPNVMRGYYRDPQATADAITADGWLRTGDLARQEADGALFIVGRSKDLIIRSGLNVYPGEVESVLNAHPAVAQSVVVGRAIADGNEEVVAFVELAAGQATTWQSSPRTPRRSSRLTSARARSASWTRCLRRRRARYCAASSRRWPPRS